MRFWKKKKIQFQFKKKKIQGKEKKIICIRYYIFLGPQRSLGTIPILGVYTVRYTSINGIIPKRSVKVLEYPVYHYKKNCTYKFYNYLM